MSKKSKAPQIPYQLAFDASMNRVCAAGPVSIISQLRALAGVYCHDTYHIPYVSFPNEKISFLMLEAVGAAEFVSEGYRNARAEALRPTQDQIDWIRKRLRHKGIDPDSLLFHQIEFLVAFVTAIQLGYKGILNMSEQGTGKTRMAIAAAAVVNAKKILTISPNSVIREWFAENDNWLGNGKLMEVWCMDTVPIKVRSQALGILGHEDGRHMSVVNYEAIKHLEMAISLFEPDMLILDESWMVKSETAIRTKVIERIADRVKYVIPQAGTPIGNNVGDLWTQVRMINKTLLPVEKRHFMTRYAVFVDLKMARGESARKPVGCLDAAGLVRILSPIWFRATKATCLNLPPKRYDRIYLDLDKEAEDLYKKVREDGEQALGDSLSLTGIMVLYIRLQQITGGFAPLYVNAEDGMDTVGNDSEVDIVLVKTPVYSVKMEWLKQWVRETLLPDPSVRACIWCRFNNEVDRITTELTSILGEGKVQPVTGVIKATDLMNIKDDYNSRNPSGRQVLVNQIDKMCSGQNLQSTDFNVIYSQTWSYIKRSQLEDRSHRLGRESAVRYFDLICNGTIDEDIIGALDRKQDLAMRLTPHTISVPIVEN